jgi:DNA-binding CsgD family transcriptional regulator
VQAADVLWDKGGAPRIFSCFAAGSSGRGRDTLTAMSGNPVGRLTPAQLACLRLLPSHGTYKCIAQQLEISPGTVAQHITEARRRLGDVSRFEAASMVAEWDAGHPPKTYIRPQTIDPEADPVMLDVLTPKAEAPVPTHFLREASISFRPGDDVGSLGPARLFRLWIRSLVDDLTGVNRVRGTFRLALVIAVTTLALVAIGNTVQVSLQIYAARF